MDMTGTDKHLVDIESHGTDDDPFTQLGRRAGAALRTPVDRTQLEKVVQRGQRVQKARVAAKLTGGAAVVIGTLVAITLLRTPDRAPVDTPPTSSAVTTTTTASEDGQTLLVLAGHNGLVQQVDYSAGGSRIITSSAGTTSELGVVRVWDAGTGDQIFEFAPGTGPLRFAISPDSEKLAVGDSAGTTTLLSASTGEVLRTFAGGNPVVFQSDSSVLVTTRGSWNTDTGTMILPFNSADEFVAISDDGTKVAIPVSSEGTIRVLDAASGIQLSSIATQMYPGAQIIFSPDGTALYGVNGPDGRDVHIWSVASGSELVSAHQDGIIFAFAIAPDGSEFLTGSRGSATLWDASTGKEIRALGNSTVYNAKFSPNGRWIVIVSDDGFSVFDRSSFELVLSAPFSTVGRDGFSEQLAFTPDSTRLVVGNGADPGVYALPVD